VVIDLLDEKTKGGIDDTMNASQKKKLNFIFWDFNFFNFCFYLHQFCLAF